MICDIQSSYVLWHHIFLIIIWCCLWCHRAPTFRMQQHQPKQVAQSQGFQHELWSPIVLPQHTARKLWLLAHFRHHRARRKGLALFQNFFYDKNILSTLEGYETNEWSQKVHACTPATMQHRERPLWWCTTPTWRPKGSRTSTARWALKCLGSYWF